jgi:tetratricopeptide (TPR) repeat protein
MAGEENSQVLKAQTNVFISYSRKDMDFVDRLGAALTARNFNPFIDRREILAFEEWWRRIQALIIKADTVIFVLSPDAIRSVVCAKEVAFASSLKKRLAPIVCRPVEIHLVPEPLRAVNFVSFHTSVDFDAMVDTLARALIADIEWIREHSWLTEVACRWDGSGQSNSMLLRGRDLLAAERWLAARPPSGPEPNDLQLALILRSKDQSLQRTRSLDEAARSSNRIVADVVNRLRGRKGISQALIARMLENAQSIVSALDADEASSVRRAKAVGLVELSSTLLAQKEAQAALVAAEAAIKTFDDFLRSQPTNSDWSSDMLVALDRAGDAYFELGQHDEALTVYERSLQLARSLVAQQTEDVASKRHLSVALEKVADGLRHSAQFGQALELYRESLLIRKQIAHNALTEEAWRDVAISLSRMAETLMSLHRREEAITSYDESLQILQNAMRLQPQNSDWQRECGLIHERIGIIYGEQAEWASALPHYEVALKLLAQLVEYDKTNVSFINDAYRGYSHVGEALVQLNQTKEALNVFQKGLALAKDQCAAQIDQTSWQAASAFYQSCSTVANTSSGSADALAVAEEAANFLDCEHNPQRTSHVAQALGNVAWYSLLSGRVGPALRAAQRANELASNNASLRLNLFYSLALSDRANEAKAIYSQCKEGHMIDAAWNEMLKRDLQEIEAHGMNIAKITDLLD